MTETEPVAAAGPTVLDGLPLFEPMPPAVRRLVADSFVRVSFPFGREIVKEGEEADAFYVLVSGRARVLKTALDGEEISLRVLEAGDGFGEAALLDAAARTATVRASSEVEALRLDRSVFGALVRNYPQLLDYFRLHARRNELFNFLRVESAFSSLSADALGLMLSELVPVELEEGQSLFRSGDPARSMFVVEEGRLRAVRDDGRPLAFYRTGDYFGERALFTSTPRAATVQALTRCRLLELTHTTFRKLLERSPDFRRAVEERASQYDYERVARVPLDFGHELLPADVGAFERAAPEAEERDAAALLEAQVAAAAPEDREFAAGRRRRIRRLPHVWQIDEMDCGAACLGMVCRHFGREVRLSHIRELVSTGTDGTSLLGIAHGARELGLGVRSVKSSPGALEQLPLPAIVHWDGNHWVVLHDVDERHVRVADPAAGPRRLTRAEFDEKWSGYAVLVSYRESFEQAPVGSASPRWLWQFVRPFRRTLVAAGLLALLAAGVQMLLPVFTQVVVDDVLPARDYGLLTVLLLGLAGAIALMIAATVVQRYLLSRAAVRMDTGTLDFVTGRLFALPMSYFNTRRAGDIQRRLAGMRQLREFALRTGVVALTAAAQLVAALVLMFVYSWLLALVFLAVAPLYALLIRFSRRRLRPLFDQLEESFGKYHSRQIDAVKGIETVKAIGAEHVLRRAMLEQLESLARRIFRADFTIMLYEGAIRAVTFTSLVLFLWVGALQVLDGALTIGEFVAFNALVVLASGPIALLLAAWDDLQVSAVLVDRVNDILEQEPEQGRDRSALRPVPTLEARIQVQNLGFHYRGPVPAPILEGISFAVPAGTRVAIVGRSGSGKTTLVKCLAGLLEPTEGTILYDGLDLRSLDHRELRRRIGFVLQESYLFDDTIARNIALGDDEPDPARIVWAARVANIHEVVERLPLGYETRVGETGLLVSGGQRQRIAIARALYHRPPVLILDEATSSLDTESERAIKESMDELLEGRTTFVIAHRLSTIRDADLILVLERGRLVERGTHEELMERQGLYYYLTSQQLVV